VIEFAGVTYAYPGAEHSAVADVDLTVTQGAVTVLLGANGSGKSTLARMANGLIAPDGGRVMVDGLCAHETATVWDVRARVGMVFQNPDNQIVGTVVEEDVAFGPENLGVERAELTRRVARALEAVGLSGFERREPHLLSGGQKQRLSIAGALAMDPAYLVFDEAKAMLDPEGRDAVDEIIGALRDEGRGVLLITHDLADLTLADDVVVLDEGRIAFSGPASSLPLAPVQLEAWGLSLPPIAELLVRLRDAGAPVPQANFDAEDIAEALWPSS
jgi:energy-coupling factor transport system ATP-binding protein